MSTITYICEDFNFKGMSEAEKLALLLASNPSLHRKSSQYLSVKFKLPLQDILQARVLCRQLKCRNTLNESLSEQRVLVIGDTHLPYEHKEYLSFCRQQYDRYHCTQAVHIGDLLDLHATSRHPFLPEAYSPGDELEQVLIKLQDWYKAFPKLKVVIGNHDMRAKKIAGEHMIAPKWIKGYAEVLQVPLWSFEESYEINGVLYTHGTGTSGVTAAQKRAIYLGQNVVMGHQHSEASILYHRLRDRTIWGMQVGCGVDENSYGMNYSKNFPKKSIISCGVVLGDQPILIIKS